MHSRRGSDTSAHHLLGESVRRYGTTDAETNSNAVSQAVPDKISPNLWAKIDLAVLPTVTMLFFLSSLDKSNISNAAVAGLLEDLHMSEQQYSTALIVTLIPYSTAQFGTNLIMKVVGPRLLLPTLAILWGLTCTIQGFVYSYGGLLACRFFLGFFEGGLLPGISLYMATFYPRQRLQFRISILLSAVTVASAFSGLLAAAIVSMHGIANKPGWAWLFILEGLFTVIYGAACYRLLPNTPKSLPFLTEADKRHIVDVLHEEGTVLADEPDEHLNLSEVGRTFIRPHVLLVSIAGLLNGATVSGLGYFLPLILTGLGYQGTDAQLMSVPPFAAAALFAVIASIFSDRYGQRGIMMIVSGTVATLGFAVFLASYSSPVRYGALFLLVPASFCIAPPLGTWVINNSAPFARRATALALVSGMTNVGAVLATWLFGMSHAPRYTSATVVLLVFQVVVVLCAAANRAWLARENKRKVKLREASGLTSPPEDGPDSIMGAGDNSVWYTFVL
ncbi:MFS general substrate transporter [Lentinus tigrinus ALCF2SS1-7]|uniref:MFS general substrate transporter n=1 Tax=Lentinus tigrinus ALCF2SS1-6 TaxID=1328759 RepID=A0A5C2RRM2_9APHY|nr:MFS general substrate transporter [Lentinus tigrinus ALCF2SS1-6]RPD75368.1 MFS general substrate transporter [Lentinus tigrinus ALCF2SS1-7]